METEIKRKISKETSEVMTNANRINNILELEIRKCEEKLEEFSRKDMERDFKKAYGEWRLLVSFMVASMTQAKAHSYTITIHSQNIENTLRKLGDDESESV